MYSTSVFVVVVLMAYISARVTNPFFCFCNFKKNMQNFIAAKSVWRHNIYFDIHNDAALPVNTRNIHARCFQQGGAKQPKP